MFLGSFAFNCMQIPYCIILVCQKQYQNGCLAYKNADMKLDKAIIAKCKYVDMWAPGWNENY